MRQALCNVRAFAEHEHDEMDIPREVVSARRGDEIRLVDVDLVTLHFQTVD